MNRTRDNGYILATSDRLVKTTSRGNKEWRKTFERVQRVDSVIQTLDGGYVLATHIYPRPGHSDIWFAKFDSKGRKKWSKTYGGSGDDWNCSVVQTQDGGYALAATTSSYGGGDSDFWLMKTDSQGNREWEKIYGGTDSDVESMMIQTHDCGYALVGRTNSYCTNGEAFWLVKTDSQGNMEWNKTFGEYVLYVGVSVVQTQDGGYALATTSYTSRVEDFWLIKTDSQGHKEWERTYGGSDRDESLSLIQTSDGGYALAGWTESYGSGDSDFWLVKADSKGNKEWSQTYGGADDDQAVSVVQTQDNGYALAGYGSKPCLVKLASEAPGRYVLSTSTDPTGSGSVSLDPPGGTYDEGTKVTITPEPASGYEFDHWSGDLSGTTETKTVKVDFDMSVTAHFTKVKKYSISTSVGSGKGSINLQPSKENYEKGTEVTVTANPSSGYEFDHWSGDVSGTSRTVTMDSNVNITAHFTEMGGEEGGGLPLTWVAAGIIVIAVIAVLAGKKS